MITVLSGTDRKDSMTKIVSNYVHQKVKTLEDQVQLLSLEELPEEIFDNKNYDPKNHSEAMNNMQDQYLINADKLILIAPEYNGSFPGSLKHFIDIFSVRNYAPTFKGKKVALIGVSSGRAGNLRGMDHLSAILMHVGLIIYPNQLPISSVKDAIEDNKLTAKDSQQSIDAILEGFVKF